MTATNRATHAPFDLGSTSQLTHAQLRSVFEAAHTKQRSVGVDYELMPYRLLDGGTVYYDRGVKPLMLALAAKYNVSPILANHILTGIDAPLETEKGAVTPAKIRYGAGAQVNVELDGGDSLGDLRDQLRAWIAALVPTAQPLGLGFAGIGYHPDRDPNAIQIVSKQRYPVMVRRFRQSGARGLHMMTATAGVSVRVSVHDEKDAIEKFRVAVALTPVLQAIFANSPMDRGRVLDVQSQRILTWFDVDRARTMFFTQAFERDFSYDRYIAWALQVPVVGIDRDGRAIDVGDLSFKDCLTTGKLYIGVEDWAGHLATLWPAVRFVPQGIELRMADTGSLPHVLALAAMVKGLLHAPKIRKQVLARFVADGEFSRLPMKAAKHGLFGGGLLEKAQEAVQLARAGLPASEADFLEPVQRALAMGVSPADEIRERWGRDWKTLHELFTSLRVTA
jgi:glutamate--cysteine ligase